MTHKSIQQLEEKSKILHLEEAVNSICFRYSILTKENENYKSKINELLQTGLTKEIFFQMGQEIDKYKEENKGLLKEKLNISELKEQIRKLQEDNIKLKEDNKLLLWENTCLNKYEDIIETPKVFYKENVNGIEDKGRILNCIELNKIDLYSSITTKEKAKTFLFISEEYNSETLKYIYRSLLNYFHPDKIINGKIISSIESEEITKKINASYELLK